MSEEKTTNKKQWAGAFSAYKPSREAIMLNISTILLIIVAVIFAEILLQAIFNNDNFSGLINLLAAPLFTYAIYSGVYGKKVEPGKIIEKTSPFYLRLILLSVLISISLFASFILLIIPFFFVMPRLVLAPYYLVHKNLDVMEAFSMSWEKSKQHQGKVWGIIGASIVMVLPAITIIGIPVAIYLVFMYSAASAVLFKFVAGAK